MKNQAHPIIVVKRRKPKATEQHMDRGRLLMPTLCRNDGLFSGDVADLYLQSKRVIQIAEYFRTPLATAVTGGDAFLIVKAQFPVGVMITPKVRGSE